MKIPALRRLRLSRLMSQEELSKKSGVSTETIGVLENGKRGCYPQTAKKLLSALGVLDVTDYVQFERHELEGKKK